MLSQTSTKQVTLKVDQGWWDAVWLVDHEDNSISQKSTTQLQAFYHCALRLGRKPSVWHHTGHVPWTQCYTKTNGLNGEQYRRPLSPRFSLSIFMYDFSYSLQKFRWNVLPNEWKGSAAQRMGNPTMMTIVRLSVLSFGSNTLHRRWRADYSIVFAMWHQSAPI